ESRHGTPVPTHGERQAGRGAHRRKRDAYDHPDNAAAPIHRRRVRARFKSGLLVADPTIVAPPAGRTITMKGPEAQSSLPARSAPAAPPRPELSPSRVAVLLFVLVGLAFGGWQLVSRGTPAADAKSNS